MQQQLVARMLEASATKSCKYMVELIIDIDCIYYIYIYIHGGHGNDDDTISDISIVKTIYRYAPHISRRARDEPLHWLVPHLGPPSRSG